MQQKSGLDRKKRIAIFAIITLIGISIAYYNSQVNSGYKNTKTWDFDLYQNGSVPPGFSEMSTDQKTSWLVKSESSAPSRPNVLVKLPLNDTRDTHIQIIPDFPTTNNANVTMKFKIISGEKAKSAGMIIRFIYEKHYFVLMADSMNNRLSLCKQTPDYLICNYDKQVTITSGEWHKMKAIVSSQGIAGFFDDQLLIKSNDHNYPNGNIGLWTKKDTGVYFDDLKVEY
jgi:hypothetical protein